MPDVILNINQLNTIDVHKYLDYRNDHVFSHYEELEPNVFKIHFKNQYNTWASEIDIPNKLKAMGNSTDTSIYVPVVLEYDTGYISNLFQKINPHIAEFMTGMSSFEFLIRGKYRLSNYKTAYNAQMDLMRDMMDPYNEEYLEILVFASIVQQFYLGEDAKRFIISQSTANNLRRLISRKITLHEVAYDEALYDSSFKYEYVETCKSDYTKIEFFTNRLFVTANFEPFEHNKEFKILDVVEKKVRETL